MKWMAVILMLGSHERIDKFDMHSKTECSLWGQQQYYAPQFHLSVGPMIVLCKPYWEV